MVEYLRNILTFVKLKKYNILIVFVNRFIMKEFGKSVLCLYACAIILVSFVFTTAECKTSRSRVPQDSSKVSTENTSSNLLYSVAKSLTAEAVSQFQETARRNPRLGFNITMLLPGITNLTNGSLPFRTFLGTATQLGAVGIKGGILGLKAAIVQGIVLLLFIVFLLTGIAYFACNIGIISCRDLGGSLGNLGGGLEGLGGLGGGNPFSRAGYYGYHPNNLHRATSTIYNAIDDGQKKYT